MKPQANEIGEVRPGAQRVGGTLGEKHASKDIHSRSRKLSQGPSRTGPRRPRVRWRVRTRGLRVPPGGLPSGHHGVPESECTGKTQI